MHKKATGLCIVSAVFHTVSMERAHCVTPSTYTYSANRPFAGSLRTRLGLVRVLSRPQTTHLGTRLTVSELQSGNDLERSRSQSQFWGRGTHDTGPHVWGDSSKGQDNQSCNTGPISMQKRSGWIIPGG